MVGLVYFEDIDHQEIGEYDYGIYVDETNSVVTKFVCLTNLVLMNRLRPT